MRITVSGLPGSGTTSLGKGIASECGYTFISAGEVFRECARERNMDLASFGKLAENDPSIDRLIDERQKEIGMSLMISSSREGLPAGWSKMLISGSGSPQAQNAAQQGLRNVISRMAIPQLQ